MKEKIDPLIETIEYNGKKIERRRSWYFGNSTDYYVCGILVHESLKYLKEQIDKLEVK
ncbi:hypothetical protein AGMMS49991_06820 [Spirochaetia bacterium]|nr:hypothetical protein AGMMS49991_06820 [Spirochaetia bacterium]